MSRSQNAASEFTLSREQIERLIHACTSLRDRALVGVLYWCALRRSEASALDVRDIDVEARRLHVREGKGHKERVVPVPAALLSDLRLVCKGRTAGPVFVSQKPGPRGRPHAIGPTQVWTIVSRAGQLAGIESPNPRRKGINPHLLRHSFARHFLDAGGQLRALSYILGHESVATTADVYGTPSVEFIQGEYEKIMGGQNDR